MALKSILLDIYYGVDVLTYGDMDSYIKDSNRHFLHFFVDSDILFSEVDEFETLKQQTTVLSDGPAGHFEAAGYHVLDVSMPSEDIRKGVTDLQLFSIFSENNPARITIAAHGGHLSKREKEVLSYIVKGLINKEIAEELKISLPTVIFHRNNICEKLQTRSIGKLTVFAVLSGIVDINEI